MTETDDANPAEIREAALRLLARREHSRLELSRKLKQRGWADCDVEVVIDELADENLQSEARFAESFVRQRVARAYGPMRIRAELSERGLDRAEITRALETESPDWFAIAADWYEKRYGPEPPADLKEKSRRQQALARRGFAHEHIRELFD
ncbi:regulatory protein RecX [Wenzhouxiangella sediminis]|uniref:Regulatory protein RecX n=1 Tax=Wenzhouxiangella sediminis TaxID=1792836 RepID=A0A3E1KE45_9GAMM|nr:regulatory protein RecX [Wenzhouxiangella sediminis]RFF32886.1 regulatory protein RecX [Wenzhouxiangella sediminis]